MQTVSLHFTNKEGKHVYSWVSSQVIPASYFTSNRRLYCESWGDIIKKEGRYFWDRLKSAVKKERKTRLES